MAAEDDAPRTDRSQARASDPAAKGKEAERGPLRPPRKNAAEAPPENAVQAMRRRRKPRAPAARGAAGAAGREQAQLGRVLARRLARPAATPEAVPAEPAPATPEPVPAAVQAERAVGRNAPPDGRITGRLLDHGRDHYRHDPDQAP